MKKDWQLAGILAILPAALTFAFAAQAGATEATRGALWRVVQTCVASHALTGAAFPCLEVNVSGGDERGYVILRPPLGQPDIILAPTREIVGIEDPSLQSADAPNYFEDAWNARAFLSEAHKKPLGRDDVVLAVNSRLARTQDQLHIHIGCLSAQSKRALQALAPDLPQDRWIRIGSRPITGKPVRNPGYWGRRVDQETLAGVNPFRLAAEGGPDLSANRSQLAIVVAGVELADGRGGFVMLASRNDPSGPIQFMVEEFLDDSCSL